MNTAANPATATGQRVVRVVDARVLCSRIGAVDLDRCRECDYLLRLRVTGEGRSAEGEVICSDAGATLAQVVVMAIPPGGEIGEEVHPATDQVLLFVDGRAKARLGDESFDVRADDLVFVRAGTRHNFVNTGQDALRLLTVYAPPEHAPGTVHRTKAEADATEG